MDSTATSVLRHPEDRWPVAFTATLCAIQLGLYARCDDPWKLGLAVALLFPVQSVAIACAHYHHHRNVFRIPFLNRCYEVVLFLQTGLPPFLLTLHHNLGHHAHYLDTQRDSLRWTKPGGAPMSLPEYLIRNFLGVYPRTFGIGVRAPRVLRRFKRMLPPSAAPLALLLLARPSQALIVFALPMVPMVFNVIRIGYHQHAGLDVGSHLTASRNDLGALYNRLSFNSGFHTAHHMRPDLPWFRLPEFHREIEARIPAALLGLDPPPARALRRAEL